MATILMIGGGVAFGRVEDILLTEGHFVPRTTSPQQAAEMVANYKPDLVLAELQPSAKACIAAMRSVQRSPENGLLQWVIFTQKGGAHELRQCLNAGASDYLIHPARKDHIIAMVKARLRAKQRQARALEERMSNLRLTIVNALPHEIRTPLSSIIGFSHLIQEQLPTLQTSEILEMATLSHQSALRIQRLLENFMYFSHLEAAATDQTKVQRFRKRRSAKFRTKLMTVAQERSVAYSRTADLSINIDEMPVRMGTTHLVKVFDELLDNAFKFSPEGTQVEVKSIVDNRMYALLIRDQGVGMAEDMQAYIGAFSQVERGVYEQAGVGLGLAIVSRLLALYRGRFLVRSESASGTIVGAYVPLA